MSFQFLALLIVNEMFNWIANNVDDRIKYGLDYALISWYIDDCTSNPVEPDWNQVFANVYESNFFSCLPDMLF